jgi:hypothetical protein
MSQSTAHSFRPLSSKYIYTEGKDKGPYVRENKVICQCQCGSQSKKTSQLVFEWFTISLSALTLAFGVASLVRNINNERLNHIEKK